MIPSPRRIQAVLFDLDDTLLDWSQQSDWINNVSGPHLENIYRYLASQGNCLPPPEVLFQTYQNVISDSWREAKKTWAGVNFEAVLTACFAASGLNAAAINMHDVLLAYDWKTVPNVSLFADTLPVLNQLHQQNYKMGLITNSMMPMWMRDIELRDYGILHFFDVRLASGDVGYMKPHPAIYERALALLGVTAETAVFVGDRPANDIVGANAVGLTSVWINQPHLQHEPGDVIPDYEIQTLSELLPILAAIEQSES